MVDESKVKKIITERKKRLKPDEFKKYLREINRSFGTNFTALGLRGRESSIPSGLR